MGVARILRIGGVMEYEYGIWCDADDTMHRGPWSKDEADEWMHVWYNECVPNNPKAQAMFRIVRRPVGRWEAV